MVKNTKKSLQTSDRRNQNRPRATVHRHRVIFFLLLILGIVLVVLMMYLAPLLLKGNSERLESEKKIDKMRLLARVLRSEYDNLSKQPNFLTVSEFTTGCKTDQYRTLTTGWDCSTDVYVYQKNTSLSAVIGDIRSRLAKIGTLSNANETTFTNLNNSVSPVHGFTFNLNYDGIWCSVNLKNYTDASQVLDLPDAIRQDVYYPVVLSSIQCRGNITWQSKPDIAPK